VTRAPRIPAAARERPGARYVAGMVARMSDYVISVVLGIVEGLTEFLPVSSTAHLRITESLLHVSLSSDYWKMYSIVIQLGAILCLPLFFRARIQKLLATFPRGPRDEHTLFNHPLSLVLIATACTAIPAFVVKKLIDANLESLSVIGTSLVVGGVVMVAVDLWRARAEREGPERWDNPIKTWEMEEMTVAQSIWIGLCQTLAALYPGTSRSMATIASGQIAGLSRATALEFSFFVSMPTMAIATGYDFLKWRGARAAAAAGNGAPATTTHEWIVLAIGFVTAFAAAYGTVAWFMAWVRKHGFLPFGAYRIAVGAAVLVWMARAP
jgi:undecaprenyl-diphosphatase